MLRAAVPRPRALTHLQHEQHAESWASDASLQLAVPYGADMIAAARGPRLWVRSRVPAPLAGRAS